MAEMTVRYLAAENVEETARQAATMFGETVEYGIEKIFMPEAETVRVQLKTGKIWQIKASGNFEDDGGGPSGLEIEPL